MQIEHENAIIEELNQWGWWAQDCPSKAIGYKRKVSLVPIQLDKASVSTPTITDKRAVEIDQAIAKLFKGDKDSIKAIRLRFICGLGYRDIGKAVGVNKDKAQKMIEVSIGWLSGYLYRGN